MNREFFQPKTLEEALLLRKIHDNSSLLAGGTDLVVAMRSGEGPEGSIIDLSKLGELKEIEIHEDEIKIGAMVTFTEAAVSKVLREKADIICLAAETVGSPQIRNKGTIGGNICNASPAADVVTPLVCLGAEVELQSIDSYNIIQKRRMLLEGFIIGSKKIVLGKNEILTGVIFKAPSPDIMTSFSKIGRRNALAIARLNGACALKIENNKIQEPRLSLGAATSRPERFTAVEDFLKDKELSDEILKTTGNLASDYVLKQTGIRPSSNYKLPVVAKFTASLIEAALRRDK